MADLAFVKELASADNFLAVLATTSPSGNVHASLVKAGVLNDPEDGTPSVGIVVAGQARKLQHLRSSGRAAVVFKDGWRWVAVEGPTRLEGPDDPVPRTSERQLAATIREVYEAAGGTHEDWKEFDRVMAEDRRCAVFVRALNITSNA